MEPLAPLEELSELQPESVPRFEKSVPVLQPAPPALLARPSPHQANTFRPAPLNINTLRPGPVKRPASVQLLAPRPTTPRTEAATFDSVVADTPAFPPPYSEPAIRTPAVWQV